MKRKSLLFVLVVLAGLALCVRGECKGTDAPLDTYIRQPDASYTWSKGGETKLSGGGTLVKINMTSQTWQGIPWKHELDVIRPEKTRGSVMVLLIEGGPANQGEVDMLAEWVNSLGIPIAVLFDIPNQPLFDGKYEDALIAYTFVQCVKTGDKTWPLLFPMTKSAVRAMDTIQKVASDEWKSPVNGFVVTGASKRGWTSWLTGVVDKRVVGIAPMVYDNLNLSAQMEQQLAVYGKYSSMISDYTENGLPQMLSTKEGKEFARMVDPYSFLDRLTMPKLLILASNDPYWTLESPDLYWNDLKGDKHIFYAPNGVHDLGTVQQGMLPIAYFTAMISGNKLLPKMTWDYKNKDDGLQLTIRPVGMEPASVHVWTAASDTKDFRKAKWTDQKIEGDKGEWAFTLPKPKTGFAAVFGQVTYQYTKDATPLSLSTTPKMIGAK